MRHAGEVKANLSLLLRIGALVMAVFALIAATQFPEDFLSIGWTIWVSAALMAFFAERVIEPLL